MTTGLTTRRPLSVAAAIEKSQLGSGDPVIGLLDIHVVNRMTGIPTGEHIRVANIPSEVSTANETEGGVTFRGNYYQPAAYDIKLKEEAGAVPEIALTIKDVTGLVRHYVDIHAGGVGFIADVYYMFRSALDLPEQRVEIQESFIVISASVADRDVSFTLGAPSLLAIDFPRRRQTKNFCQFSYKGTGCEYSGAMESCDRTLSGPNGCRAHGNAVRFGGFPGIEPR